MARVVVTRRLPGTALDRLAAEHELDVWPEPRPPTAPELREQVGDAEGLISLLTDRVDAELMAAAPRLRAVANYAVGTDNVDLAAAAERGIAVGNTPDVLTDATADLTLALMLALARRLPEAEAAVRGGRWKSWEPEGLLGRDLHGATVGIVGRGRIGSAVGRRLRGFDTHVIEVGRGDDLGELLSAADFVTLHVPLTPQTRGLIGERELGAMRPEAFLVNTARGPLVASDALARALHDGRIAGAALDVTDPEPLPPDHPLLEAPNLIVVPHIGSATHSAREAMAHRAVDNLLAALVGRPMPYPV